MRRLGPALALALGAVSLLAGCGGDKGLSGNYSVEASLRELPYVSEGTPLTVVTGDLDRATELGGVKRPAAGADTVEWGQALSKEPVSIPAAEDLKFRYLPGGQMRDLLGLDMRDVRSYASVESPPHRITVLRVTDGTKLKKGLPTSGGVTTTEKGKVGEITRGKATEPPLFVAIEAVEQQDDRVALAQESRVLKDWSDDGGKTMADHQALLEVARALDDQDVYGAVLLDGAGTPQNLTPQSAAGVKVKMPKFDAVAVGQAVEKGHSVEYVAYRVSDPDAAKTGIGKVWAEGTSLATREQLSRLVRVDGVSTGDHVVVVKLKPEANPGVAMEMLYRSDLPFVVLP